jgi:hypothetical protein
VEDHFAWDRSEANVLNWNAGHGDTVPKYNSGAACNGIRFVALEGKTRSFPYLTID